MFACNKVASKDYLVVRSTNDNPLFELIARSFYDCLLCSGGGIGIHGGFRNHCRKD